MRVELPVCSVGELATAKEESFRPVGEVWFHPRGGRFPAQRSKSESARDEFPLGSQLFTPQLLGFVTLFSNQKKFAARQAKSPESESNQSPEPTRGTGPVLLFQSHWPLRGSS